MSRETDLAWAAGFFDGEGSICVHNIKRHKGGTTGKYYSMVSVSISLSQTRPEPLQRFVDVIQQGKVHGPFKQKNTNHKDYYTWMQDGRPS